MRVKFPHRSSPTKSKPIRQSGQRVRTTQSAPGKRYRTSLTMPTVSSLFSSLFDLILPFLSAVPRSLRRVVLVAPLNSASTTTARFVIFRSASVRPKHLFDPYFDQDYLFELPLEGAGCPFKWTMFYFSPCPVPSCPTYEPNSNDDEYSHPFLHIQYKRTPSRRPIATLAMLLCRRIARCMYRRRQCGLMRAAAWAASTSKKRNKEFPCLLMCPSRCLPALESSLGIMPTYVPICFPRWKRSVVPMINTKASAVSAPTPGWVINRSTSGCFLASRSTALLNSSILGSSRSNSSSNSLRRRLAQGANGNFSSSVRPCVLHSFVL